MTATSFDAYRRGYAVAAAWFRFSLLAAVACAMMAVRSGTASTSAASRSDIPAPTSYHGVQPIGSVGCSASSCHGGGTVGKVGSEFNTWLEKDPHSKAYQILFNNVSVRIARNLDPKMPAHESVVCLKCHGPSAVPNPKEVVSEGVGCEGCHGPANAGYLTRHYQADWKTFDAKAKATYGLVDTKGLAGRVTQCSVCHVGDADHDVTHDLIAAGHPRMFFEYTSFQNNPGYTPHWREKDPQFEAKAWAIGQAATAKAHAKLTEARATKAHAKGAVWPEFAEYACFSCHQGINGGEVKSPGVLDWNRSPYLYAGPMDAAELATVLAGRSDPGQVSRMAGELAIKLEDSLRVREAVPQYDLAEIARLDAWVAAHPAGKDWESQVQHYLARAALAAAKRRQGGTISEGERAQLLEMRNRLRYPTGYNSPKQADMKP